MVHGSNTWHTLRSHRDEYHCCVLSSALWFGVAACYFRSQTTLARWFGLIALDAFSPSRDQWLIYMGCRQKYILATETSVSGLWSRLSYLFLAGRFGHVVLDG